MPYNLSAIIDAPSLGSCPTKRPEIERSVGLGRANRVSRRCHSAGRVSRGRRNRLNCFRGVDLNRTSVVGRTRRGYRPGMALAPEAEPFREDFEQAWKLDVTGQARQEALRREGRRVLDAEGGWSPPSRASMTLRDFLASRDDEGDEIPFIIPGTLPQQCRLLLTGEEGRGKSTLIRWVGCCHAAGVHPWTGQPYNGGVTLLVDAENPPALLRQRLAELTVFLDHYVPGARDKILDRLIVESQPAGFDLAAEVWAAYLGQIIADHQPGLVTGGPLYKLASLPAKSEEFFEAVSGVLGRLQDQRGFSLMLEAHTRQDGQDGGRPEFPYGNTGWRRWPDMGYHLNARGDLTDWRGNRYGSDAPWPARLNRMPGSNVAWTSVFASRGSGVAAGDVDAKVAEVVGVVTAQPGINQTELRKLVGGKGNQWIEAATDRRAIAVQPGGPGKPTRYYPVTGLIEPESPQQGR